MRESIPEPSRSSPEHPVSLAEIAIPVQAMLALCLYQRLHPEESIDTLHPSMVDRSIRGKAMELWLDEQNGEALSARFRSYIEDPVHAEEHILLSDPNALEHVLDEIGVPRSTMH